MTRDEFDSVCRMVWSEIARAERKWPGWPTDAVHAAAVVSEESGELVQASLDYTYDSDCAENLERMRAEAVHTAVTAIRFVAGIDNYKQRTSEGVR